MNAAIRRLVRDLDRLPACTGLDELFAVVKGHAITLDAVAEFVRFDPARYHRELMVKADDYQLLVLAWLPEQKSPIHNQAFESNCPQMFQPLYHG